MNDPRNILRRTANARAVLEKRLLEHQGADGLWTGRLSSSAVSTAVATLALEIAAGQDSQDPASHLPERGRRWLATHRNPDGGWGDTPESPSNLSATLLARAALLRNPEPSWAQEAIAQADTWLKHRLGGTDPETLRQGVLRHYGQDRTFAVPILVACALASQAADREGWRGIPLLPFELALIPHRLYRFARMPVVSYAIPALIAVGLAQHRQIGSRRNPGYHLRELAVPRLLRLLERMQPAHGGFLEAAPLTGFVAMSLAAAGEPHHPVTRKALQFLAAGIRDDGSWPIDTNLSLWLTGLAVKALAGSPALDQPRRDRLLQLYLDHQGRSEHPFTRARAGGWGWTTQPGSVPDADDTASALLALRHLGHPYSEQVGLGLDWLLDLANADGGIPTFCRGWGRLPFDRSSPDISAHALAAYGAWRECCPPRLQQRLDLGAQGIRRYLRNAQDGDGAWTPLWFGDQQAPGQRSRVYGTAAVLEALAEDAGGEMHQESRRAGAWLRAVQNDDGGWGGDAGCPSTVECTGRAVAALARFEQDGEAALRGARWLCDQIESTGPDLKASPVGLYFASLWYDEALYPLLFAIPALREMQRLRNHSEP